MTARPPAPPYRGEGPHALWHVSEDPGLDVLVPHVPATNPDATPAVWAVDTRHLPLYWFPRDCPRGCIWPAPDTTDEDRERFGLVGEVSRVHAIHTSWRDRQDTTTLQAYPLLDETFRPHPEVGGYWTSTVPVRVGPPTTLDGLAELHAATGIELRVVDDLLGWWEEVVDSTVEYSGIRLANAR